MTDSPTVRIDRANRVQAALQELNPLFDALVTALSQSQRAIVRAGPAPRWDDKLKMTAMAWNMVEDLRSTMKAMAEDGDLARHAAEYARDVERMSPEQRRYADALGS